MCPESSLVLVKVIISSIQSNAFAKFHDHKFPFIASESPSRVAKKTFNLQILLLVPPTKSYFTAMHRLCFGLRRVSSFPSLCFFFDDLRCVCMACINAIHPIEDTNDILPNGFQHSICRGVLCCPESSLRWEIVYPKIL